MSSHQNSSLPTASNTAARPAMSGPPTHEEAWRAKIHHMREQAEAIRRRNAAAFPWFNAPGSATPRPKTSFTKLPARLQVKILSYLAPDIHVTLRRPAKPTRLGSNEAVAVYILNYDEWLAYEGQFHTSKGFRQRMNEAWKQEIASKRISIVLDMRYSVQSTTEPAVGDRWYSFKTVTNELADRLVPDQVLRQYLSLKIAAPYHVDGVTKLFTAAIIRPRAEAPVEKFQNARWITIRGFATPDIGVVFAGIGWKIHQPFTLGTDFGAFWVPWHLEYFHNVLANIATKDVTPGRPELPRPSSMADALRTYRELTM